MTPELDDDTELRRAFRDLADAATPHVRPPGAELAQRRARSRVRARRLAVATAAALAILVPAGVVAATRNGGSSSLPVAPATSVATPTGATPTEVPSPAPEYGPDGELLPGPGALANATLALDWPEPEDDATCGGSRTFVDGVSSVSGRSDVRILSSMRFDVDGDGASEIVANVFCQLGQVGPMQLVAVRMGSTPLVLGPVLVTSPTDGGGGLIPLDGPGVATIIGYAGLDNGLIQIDVKSKLTCCGTPPDAGVVQQRTYRWTGSSFAQVGGPTTFVADPAIAELVATVPGLVLGPPVEGYRSGTLSVSIHNNGPQTAVDVSVYVSYHLGIEEPAGGDWDRCRAGDHEFIGIQDFAVCRIGDIPPGQSVTITLPMRRDATHEGEEGPPFTENTGRVEVRTGAFYYPGVTFDITAQ